MKRSQNIAIRDSAIIEQENTILQEKISSYETHHNEVSNLESENDQLKLLLESSERDREDLRDQLILLDENHQICQEDLDKERQRRFVAEQKIRELQSQGSLPKLNLTPKNSNATGFDDTEIDDFKVPDVMGSSKSLNFISSTPIKPITKKCSNPSLESELLVENLKQQISILEAEKQRLLDEFDEQEKLLNTVGLYQSCISHI